MTNKSNCCNAEIKSICADEGTCYMVCLHCSQSCDLANEKPIKGISTWALQENPLYMMTCPHCKKTVFMSKEPLIKRLLKWAKMLKNI